LDVVERIAGDFAVHLAKLLLHQSSPPAGSVPQSVFWLIFEEQYVGMIKIRHRLSAELSVIGGHMGYEIRPTRRGQGLGTQMLALGLREAGLLGLRSVLVTCDESNVGSRRVIERNGGQLEACVSVEQWPVRVARYWIPIAPPSPPIPSEHAPPRRSTGRAGRNSGA
jgi:predicted acetyltransferase